MAWFICTKCGNFGANIEESIGKPCWICGGERIKVTNFDDSTFDLMTPYEREQFAIQYVGHDFDPEFKPKRIKIQRERWGLDKPAQPANVPKCPICQSTNLSKISTVGKAAKIGLFGIFGAGDIGKTWKCNNCGSKF